MDDFTLTSISILTLTIATFDINYHTLRRRSPPPSHPPTTTTPPILSPPKLPIICHLHLLTSMPHHSFAKLSRQLGPIIHLQLGRVPTIVISSPQLAQLVLKTHDHVFSNRPHLISAQYLSFNCSDVTFSRYGPYWRQARKISVTELLSPKRVNSLRLVRVEEVTRAVQSLSTRTGMGGETNMSELFFGLANNVLCRVAFGRRFSEEGRKKDLVGVLMESQELLAGFYVGDFFTGWEWVNSVSEMNRRLMKNLGDLRAVRDGIIYEHLEKKRGWLGKKIFLTFCSGSNKVMTLKSPSLMTTSKLLFWTCLWLGQTRHLLDWTMTELARHPNVIKKAQNEVRKIAGSVGEVDESHLQHLYYLKAVIKETMRLHPVVPLLVPGESMEKCTLHGYEIPEKTRVLINTYAIGRDPQSWENPLDYNPERFMETEIDFRGQDFRFLLFEGGRSCPGFSFGLATVEIALARLLYHFDWELPHGVGADDVDLSEIFGLATRKKTALMLVPTIRKDHGAQGVYA